MHSYFDIHGAMDIKAKTELNTIMENIKGRK